MNDPVADNLQAARTNMRQAVTALTAAVEALSAAIDGAAKLAPSVELRDDLQAFTYIEVGKRLGLSRSTVARMVKAGELRAIVVWGRPRILPADLRSYLEQQAVPPWERARRTRRPSTTVTRARVRS
jgi:excisionase family DNA binding protein